MVDSLARHKPSTRLQTQFSTNGRNINAGGKISVCKSSSPMVKNNTMLEVAGVARGVRAVGDSCWRGINHRTHAGPGGQGGGVHKKWQAKHQPGGRALYGEEKRLYGEGGFQLQ